MNIGDYIKSETWNVLPVKDQLLLINYLRFIGHRVLGIYLPPCRIDDYMVVSLDIDGDLMLYEFNDDDFNQAISLEELNKMISLGTVV